MANESGYDTSTPTAVPLGSDVVLVVSKGPATAQQANAPVPVVVGKPQADALEAMQQIGLNPQVFTQMSREVERGSILAQWPKPADLAAAGSNAVLLVSSGPAAEGTALIAVPTVIGASEADARATLQRAGLHPVAVGVDSPTVPEGVVLGQLPEEHAVAPAPKKSNAWLWVLGALAVLVVVAAVVWFTGPGKPAETVAVPGVVGLAQAQAEDAITTAGLVVGTITESPSTTATAGSVMSQDPAKGVEVDKGSKVDLVVAIKSNLVAIPDVTGMSKDEAIQALARVQLKVAATETPSDKVPAGDVVSQSPKAGQQVPLDTEVGIVVSTGPAEVSVPDVKGVDVGTAIQNLDKVGLVAKPVNTYSSTIPVGQVVSQAPPAGTLVAPGSTIQLLVCAGPAPAGVETVNVPNVVGKTLADATAAITDAGLKALSVEMDGSGEPAGQVLYQTPAAGESVPRLSQVALLVSSGK